MGGGGDEDEDEDEDEDIQENMYEAPPEVYSGVVAGLASTVGGKVFYNWWQKPGAGDTRSAADILKRNIVHKEAYQATEYGDMLHYSIIPELSDLSKLCYNGPWQMQTDHTEKVQQIADDVNLTPLANVLALDDLGSTFPSRNSKFCSPYRQ